MSRVIVRDPDTRRVVTEWDDGPDQPRCHPYEYGSLCGGCVDCMEMQAEYAGYIIERKEVRWWNLLWWRVCDKWYDVRSRLLRKARKCRK